MGVYYFRRKSHGQVQKVYTRQFKVVGVGSVGTVCGIILSMSGKGDALFLQFKQARQSVLEPYCGAGPYTDAGGSSRS
jgi:hypothetical protein